MMSVPLAPLVNAKPSPATTLVIGYGNSTRGDDGVGYLAAEWLADELSNPDVQVVIRQQLALELAVELSEVDRAILIDAAQGGPAGRVSVEKIEPALLPPEPFTHELKPATLLECTRALYGRCPETWLVTIAGESFDFSDQLTASVAAAFPEVLARVRELVETQIHSPAILT